MDTLSQLLNLGNVRPKGRYIVVDDASGVVVSAVLERMGGMSTIYFTPEKSLLISYRGRATHNNTRF